MNRREEGGNQKRIKEKSLYRIIPLGMHQCILLQLVIFVVLEHVLAYTMLCDGQPMINGSRLEAWTTSLTLSAQFSLVIQKEVAYRELDDVGTYKQVHREKYVQKKTLF
ncbi:hypothetical protein RB195_020658 [Necator americanus]|uniref:Uncharacterized protein n=1 Tax=Necator americanus TaxID=51031 RepID=A0ABR1CLA0_NECAM